jgi:uncharacterized protein YukE
VIDTEVAGDPASVTAAATWLRDTLAVKVADAADHTQSARNSARGSWEGESASSYQAMTHEVVDMADKHESRIKRAAGALEDYAARLRGLETAMTGIRSRASAGGLVVDGTVIHPPPPAPMGPFEPGSDAERNAQQAVTRIELWNTLVTEAADEYRRFTEWVDAELPGDVTNAQEKDGSADLFGTMVDLFPNFAAGAGAGALGNGLLRKADDYRAAAREFRRRSRVSGNPAVRGQADTPAGRATLDDLLDNAGRFGRFGRFLAGPGGILIDVGFGIHEGMETGDWTRAALTTGTSIAVGVGAAALVAAGVISAPALVVVIGAGAVAAGASWLVGEVYDNWDDITDTVGDAWDSTTEAVGDAWDSASDAVGDAWDSVTPW